MINKDDTDEQFAKLIVGENKKCFECCKFRISIIHLIYRNKLSLVGIN